VTTPPSESEFVLDSALTCFQRQTPEPIIGPISKAWSERCVEVPWVAGYLRNAGRLLDVGWAMSPPEWIGILFAVIDRGSSVVGIDIIDPKRVASRYPETIRDRVLGIPVRVESILDAEPSDGLFDTITCVSTLEHIGFDIASDPDVTDTAFIRAKDPANAIGERDPRTDRLFMDAASRFLRPGGSLLVSVPAGQGVPILHQDSLGLFTHQFEYDEASWKHVIGDERFSLDAEAYFRHDEEAGWQPVATFDDLTDQTSALRPFATGCAMAHLVRR
jgi:SAM-dependent methyltransferase